MQDNSGYLDTTSKNINQEIDERCGEASKVWQQWQNQAAIDTKMAMGDQNVWNQICPAQYQNSLKLKFDRTTRDINLISGWQIKHRNTSIVSPIQDGSEEVARDKSGVLQWCNQVGNYYNVLSDAIRGSLQCGLNMIYTYLDYSQDVESGMIKYSRQGYTSIMTDPWWVQPDLSDCGWILNRQWLSKNSILSVLPDSEYEMNHIPNSTAGFTNRTYDNKFLLQPQLRNGVKYRDLYAYDEYWTRECRKVSYILDRATGQLERWPDHFSKEELKQTMKDLGEGYKLVKISVPTVRRRVLVNSNVIEDEQKPWGLDRYPFTPILTYFNSEASNYSYRFQGFPRKSRDAQIEYNIIRNNMLASIVARVTSGVKVKAETLVDDEDAYLTGDGRAYFLRADANMDDLQIIDPPPAQNGYSELVQLLKADMPECNGINEQLFGQVQGDQSGFQTMLLQGAALTGQEMFFDSWKLSQKINGEITLDIADNNFSEEKITRILGREPAEGYFIPERERMYQCVVEPGLLTTTQKQMEYAQTLEIEKTFPGMLPRDYIVGKLPLQDITEVKKSVKASQEQAAEQQKFQMDLELKKLDAEKNLLDSNAEAARASARERDTRSVSNIGMAHDHIAQAEQSQATAALDTAKALREIEELDIANLQNLVNLLQGIQQNQQQNQDQNIKSAEQEAAAVGSRSKERAA